MMNIFKAQSAVEYLEKKSQENYSLISEECRDIISNSENLIDIQCSIASYFVGWWSHSPLHSFKGMQRLSPLLFSAFHKNIFLLYSALQLSVCGLFGPARPLLRNIFEWLMVSKYSSISEDTSVLEKWNHDKIIYFSNSILKKIVIPNPEPFKDFWSTVCDYSHATKFAGQLTLEIDNEKIVEELLVNLAIINLLIECNYHLLNTHLITPKFEYMGRFYNTGRWVQVSVEKEVEQLREYGVPEQRKKAHKIFKLNRKHLGKGSIKLIAAYKRKWKLSS